jgi:hypothetical protein
MELNSELAVETWMENSTCVDALVCVYVSIDRSTYLSIVSHMAGGFRARGRRGWHIYNRSGVG